MNSNEKIYLTNKIDAILRDLNYEVDSKVRDGLADLRKTIMEMY